MRQCNGICPVADLAAGSAVPRRPSAMQQQEQQLLLVLVTPDQESPTPTRHVFLCTLLQRSGLGWGGRRIDRSTSTQKKGRQPLRCTADGRRQATDDDKRTEKDSPCIPVLYVMCQQLGDVLLLLL